MNRVLAETLTLLNGVIAIVIDAKLPGLMDFKPDKDGSE